MANPSRITDFSVTASNNVPDGTDTIGSNADDLIRAIQATIRGDLAHKGSDIASATTTDLGAVQGLFHDITGTTTITGFGTVAAGVWKIIKFEGALTLTHNSTSLILPGGANITTANGDTAFMYSEGSGNWRCVVYVKAAVPPFNSIANSPGLVKLETGTVSDATLDIDMTGYTGYVNKVLIVNAIPATDGVEFYMRTSTDGGSTFASGATDYGTEVLVGGSTTTENNSAIRLTNGGLVGNAATEGVAITVTMYDTTSTTKWPRFNWQGIYVDSAGTPVVRSIMGSGARKTAQDTDAIRLLFSSGNIVGSWALYGYNA